MKERIKMFDRISLCHFKCFDKEQSVRLSRINVFYGKNGRGKSTVAQAFLLLGQTIQKGEVSFLQLNGKLVNLGMFNDVLSSNRKSDKLTLQFHLKGNENALKFIYQADEKKPSVGILAHLESDGKNLMDVKTTASNMDAEPSRSNSLSAMSGYSGYENFKNIYFVSASRKGQVNSEPRNDMNEEVVGAKGENLINVLLAKGEKFQAKVSEALSFILDGATLQAKETATREYVDLFLDSKDDGDSYRPVNVGFGYSYILPILVNALLVPEDSMLIIENPEAHLFPAAQSRLMEFLIRVSNERNIQIIVESHSDHIVNGVRISVKKGNLKRDDVVVDYFDRNTEGEIEVRDIHVDQNGELSDYPDDFMDEWTKQLLELA